jgi:hypothetical protein
MARVSLHHSRGSRRRMPADPQPLTLAEVIDRAADVVDPMEQEEGVAQLVARYEDRDEPVTAFDDLEGELAEGKGAIDPQDEDPAVVMAVAVAVYLAHRRDEARDAPEEILRLAARAEFDGEPPEPVASWLAARGIDA